MDSGVGWVIPLAEAAGVDEGLIGGKAAKLAGLARGGFRVPDGFLVTVKAYEHFVESGELAGLVRMELGRKPFAAMRWEEIWDVALRIRSAFLASPIPPSLANAVAAAVETVGASKPLAVRSSAPGEDSAGRSFAGLHESVVGVVGTDEVLDALRVVWASLWSDAALLYRQELDLDPGRSRMAVVVQEVVEEDRSGVAFGRDPRQMGRNQAIVEAVPGPGSDLVDGLVDPDRWILDRDTGAVVEWRAGQREGDEEEGPLLEGGDLRTLHRVLLEVEALFHWPPDTEWTGRGERFTLLQARPITTATPEEGDRRGWYLSLRPGMKRLRALAERVAGELIPELEEVGRRFAAEAVEELDDRGLVGAIEARRAALDTWRQVYLDDFIPFAHGVRQLGIYYNDAVQPEDPYEFVGLLRGQQMLAQRRNQALVRLAERLREDAELHRALSEAAEGGWQEVVERIRSLPSGEPFVRTLEQARTEFMDVAYGGERLAEHPELLLATVLEMARSAEPSRRAGAGGDEAQGDAGALEQRLLAAVGPERQKEARQVIEIGRLSWRLRDDDNVLVGRLESQLLRALEEAARRLRAAGRLEEGARVSLEAAPELAEGLRDPSAGPVILPEPEPEAAAASKPVGESPRQLVGQPAAPGLATGRVRPVRDSQDLGRFRAGEVLVCDAIQPTMTHLVPLAAAIVERRGGMLIHGAIIARELGIPCVNGIPDAVDLLKEGQVVTVDGHLGIVTVGAPVFDLEEG
ncbi:MAG: PEP/pyruvate-binding domain-containing protein [Anaerolineae bacterium]